MFASPGWMAAQLSEDMYANPKGMPSRLTFKQGSWVDVLCLGLQSRQSAYCKTYLSYDVRSGSEIRPCNKICKPLVVY